MDDDSNDWTGGPNETEGNKTAARLIAKHGADACTVHHIAGEMIRTSVAAAREVFQAGGRSESEAIDLMIAGHEEAARVLRMAQQYADERTQS